MCCCDKIAAESQQHNLHSWQHVAPCCIGLAVSLSSVRLMSSAASGLISTCTNSADDTLVTDEYFLNWIFHAGDCPEPAACIQRASLNGRLHVSWQRRAFPHPSQKNKKNKKRSARPWERAGCLNVLYSRRSQHFFFCFSNLLNHA